MIWDWTEEQERELLDLHITMCNINGKTWNHAFALAQEMARRGREDTVTAMRMLMMDVQQLCMASLRSYRDLEVDQPDWKVAMAAQVMTIQTLMDQAQDEIEDDLPDPENIYGIPGIRQSIEEDKK